MFDDIGTQLSYFNKINISSRKMPLKIITFGTVMADLCVNQVMMATCSFSSLVDGENSCSQTAQYISVRTYVSLSECQKR